LDGTVAGPYSKRNKSCCYRGWTNRTDRTATKPADTEFFPSLNYAHDFRLGLAAVLSFFLPGLGQIFKRQITRAFMIQGSIALLIILSIVLNVVYKMLELTGNQVAPLALLAAGVLGLIAIAIWTWQIYDASR
jgi:hypothetical protein